MQAERCGLAAGMLCWENPLIYCERSGSSRKEGNRALNRVSKKRLLPKSFPQEIFCVMGQRGCGDMWCRSLGAALLPELQPERGSSTPRWVPLGKSQLQKQTWPFVVGNFRGGQVGQPPCSSSACWGCGSQHALTMPGCPNLGSRVGVNI